MLRRVLMRRAYNAGRYETARGMHGACFRIQRSERWPEASWYVPTGTSKRFRR